MTVTDMGGPRWSDFEENGFVVMRGLFTVAEIDELCAEFAALHAAGPVPGHFEPRATGAAGTGGPGDPLDTHPRVMHPHRINELSLRRLLDPRLRRILETLLGEEVLAAQSMFYFKPPGARGQALHQDNFYLRVEPGMDLFCPEEADAELSFVREYVPPPPGLAVVPVDMAPGDVLFFNGSLVHGSGPNRSADRFRRSFIGHYVGRSTHHIGRHYPTLTMGGEPVALPESEGAGPCGTEFAPAAPH
jgi:hypothetical protein